MKPVTPILFLSLCGVLTAAAFETRDNKKNDLVVVYVGVDAVCFSTDGSKYGKFKESLDRETNVAMSADELKTLIVQLKKTGIESERNRELGDGCFPPLSFDIVVVTSGAVKEVRFYHKQNSMVPEKYLAIFAALPEKNKSETLTKFIWAARLKGKATALLSQMREGTYVRGDFPANLDWSDIPELMDLATLTDKLKTFPVDPLSSASQQPPTEGVVALWLIEGIRKGKRWPSLNPICYKAADNKDGVTNDCQSDLLVAYHKWWAHVEKLTEKDGNDVDPLAGTGLNWY